jgi:PAS domain S-box-containing protein
MKPEHIKEILALKQRIAELECLEVERRRVEKALRDSEEFFKAIIQNSTDVIIIVDKKGSIVFVSPSAKNILGYETEEVIGKRGIEFIITHDIPRAVADFVRVIETKDVVIPNSFRIRHKDGSERILEGVGINLLNIPPVEGFIMNARDITERTRAEEALRESEERYRTLIETSPDPIIMYDLNGKILTANEEAAKIYGVSNVREFLSEVKTIFDVLTEDGKTFAAANFNRTLIEGKSQKNEYLLRVRNGATITAEINSSVIKSVSGEPSSFISVIRDITDRKQAEEALKSAKKWLEDVVEFMPDAIMITDKDHKVIAWNRAIENMSGIPKADIIGLNHRHGAVGFYGEMRKSLIDLICIDDEELAAKYSHVSRVGSTLFAEAYAPAVYNNRGAYVFAAVSPFYDAEGNLVGIIEAIRDITEYKRAGEALRESEARYKLITDNMTDSIWLMDMNLKTTWISPSMERSRGFTLEELRTLPFEKHLAPGSLGMAKNIYTEALSSENLRQKDLTISRRVELELTKKDGSTLWNDVRVTLLRDTQGNPVGLLGVGRDITKRKQAEELYRTLANSSHAGVFIVQDRKFQFVNPHIPEYSGYPESELIGKNSFKFVHPDDHAQLRVNAIAMLKGERNNPYEYRIIDRTGKIKRLMETVRSITYGGKRAVLGNTMDITERYRMESLLRQSQKMEAIGTLAGGIAHDFNNILSAIMGYTEMALADHKADDRIRRYLEQVFKAGLRARDLVKQILAFSSQSDEKPRPMRVSPIIKETLKLLRASLPSTIQIHQDRHVESDVILAEPTQMHQILMNLCTNAAHAMSDRKGELKVSLCPVEINVSDDLNIHHGLSPGMYLKLTVSDTGIGIAPEIMDRIFDPFFTTKKPGEGTGMGLSVVYGIVKNFGGSITMESEKEKGSKFNVYFPLLMEERVKREREDSSHIIGGKERILFVDDEENLVQLGTELLTSLGYEVTGRTSSLEALELFRTKPDRFDLVITDMTMPNMTGVDLAREMILIRPNIPLILCTGFSEMVSKEKAKSIGIRQFIMKPLLTKRLAMTIREALDKI